MSYPESIIIAIEDIELEVYYTISKAIRGARGSCGEPLEPDEPAELDVTGVYLVDKMADIIDLFDYSIETIKEKVMEALSDE